MRPPLISLMLLSGLLLSACGDGGKATTSNDSSTGAPEMTLAQFKRRTHLCYTPPAVKTSGGERLAAAPTLDMADLVSVYRSALAPSQRGQIRRAYRFIPPSHKADLRELDAAVERGLAAVRANPGLMRVGGGFREAQRLATQADLVACSPIFQPSPGWDSNP